MMMKMRVMEWRVPRLEYIEYVGELEESGICAMDDHSTSKGERTRLILRLIFDF